MAAAPARRRGVYASALPVDELERAVVRTMSEAAWQAHVEQTLVVCGFDLIYHTHDSRRSRKGFPDLVAIRVNPPHGFTVVVAELKRWNQKPTTEQEAWLRAWRNLARVINTMCPTVHFIVEVWRPQDREQILAQLQPLEDPYA